MFRVQRQPLFRLEQLSRSPAESRLIPSAPTRIRTWDLLLRRERRRLRRLTTTDDGRRVFVHGCRQFARPDRIGKQRRTNPNR
jgi:hypothetical protein